MTRAFHHEPKPTLAALPPTAEQLAQQARRESNGRIRVLRDQRARWCCPLVQDRMAQILAALRQRAATSASLAEQIGCDRYELRFALRKLVTAGTVCAVPGRHGGWQLASPRPQP